MDRWDCDCGEYGGPGNRCDHLRFGATPAQYRRDDLPSLVFDSPDSHFTNNIIAKHQAKGEEADHTTIGALSKLARLVVIIIATLVAMQTLGFSMSGILAAGGIGGIAIGFAAKDIWLTFSVA